MKYFLVVILFPISLTAQHRTIAKTIFYDKPNGKEKFYLLEDVALSRFYIDYEKDSLGSWKELASKYFFVLKTGIKSGILQSNTKIFDNKHKLIGETLQEIDVANLMDSSIIYRDTLSLDIYGFSTLGTIKELTTNEIVQKESVHFFTKNENSFIVFGDTSIERDITYKSSQTDYKITRTYSSGVEDIKTTYGLIKKTINTSSFLDYDENETTHDITVTYFPNINKKDSIVISRKEVHDIKLINENDSLSYWQVKTYGCCMDPTKIELVSLSGNKTILTSENSYYEISFGGINDVILIGYKEKSGQGKDKNLFGELVYSINGKKADTVVLRTKQPELAQKLNQRYMKIDFLNKEETDLLNKNCYYPTYYKYSKFKNKIKSVYEASGIGLEFVFEDYKFGKIVKKKAKIPFTKGKIKEKTIYLNFE